MKFNGAIFSKPQQDQLKEIIGNELESVDEKIEEVSQNTMRYLSAWNKNTQYYIYDVVVSNRTTYVCTTANKGQKPSITSSYWVQIGCFGTKIVGFELTYNVKQLYLYIGDVLNNPENTGNIQISAYIDGAYIPLIFGLYSNKFSAHGFAVVESEGTFTITDYYITYDATNEAVQCVKRTNNSTISLTPPTNWYMFVTSFSK